MKNITTIAALSISSALWAFNAAASNTLPATADSAPPTLSQLINTALTNDATRKQFYAQSQALRETGIASSTLMDPKLKVGFGGLPVDSFEFDQDPMTNLSVGIMQQFERGSTLQLQQKKANSQADGVEAQVQARELDIIASITQLWIELGYQQSANAVLRDNRRLMLEMESFIQTNYSIGRSEAQDLLYAQLQIAKVDEKLQANQQNQRRLISQLSEWLGSEWIRTAHKLKADQSFDWDMLEQQLQSNQHQYFKQLKQHPMVKMADRNIAANQTQVDIAEQAYTPQFGVEVMYAYRQADNMMGDPASDLVSAYLTMDIPLFTGNRQDRNLAAAQYQVGAAQSQKDALLAQMNAKVNALVVDRDNLKQRLERYQNSLIPQANARIKAVERGYQNNTAQFNDVITATSDKLALELEQQRLQADWNIASSQLAALLGGYDYQVSTPQLSRESQ